MLQTQNLLTINKNTMNMKTLDMKAWAESARNGQRRLAIPIMTHPGIELCGYTVRDAVTDGEVHARAILALNDRYPADACSVIMDLTVEAEAFGAHIVFPENEVPSVTDTLVHDLSEIEALKIPTLEAGRIPQYLKANRIVAEALGDKPLFAGCIGPFSLAGRLFGMTELMMATFTEPETIQLLLKKCTRFIGDYCIALKKSGAQGVVIAEPAAGLVSNEDCSLYSSLYVRRIVELVQDDHFLVVLHNCGNTGHCTEAMVETGSAGYHFGNQAGMVAALEACPADTLVMGNIDPVGLFKQASADEMYRATQELLNATAAYPNFILSSGCDVPPETPPRQYRRLLQGSLRIQQNYKPIPMKKTAFLFAALLAVLTICATGAKASERWTKAQAQAWGEANPWFCGFNYIPANAINYTAMWDKTSFSPEVMERELALAEETGLNCARVVLQYAVYAENPKHFIKAFDKFFGNLRQTPYQGDADLLRRLRFSAPTPIP